MTGSGGRYPNLTGIFIFAIVGILAIFTAVFYGICELVIHLRWV